MVRCTTAGTIRDCKQPPSPTTANRWRLDAHGAGHVVSVQICILPTTRPPIKVPFGRSFVLWGRSEAQHSLGGGKHSHVGVLTLPSWLTDRQPCSADRQKYVRLVRLRVTQRMHVLSSFLAFCLLRTPTVLYSPLGYRDPRRWDVWRPTYMKPCFSGGGCSCSLAFFCCPDGWLSSDDPPRRSGIFNVAQDFGAWNKQKVREKEQAARHKEHASQHRPTVASVSCNGDAESRTIEFILHNIIHKYHVVSSVHESRNSLPTCSPPIALFFFSSSFPLILARTTCSLNPQRPNPPNTPNTRKRSSILMAAATPG